MRWVLLFTVYLSYFLLWLLLPSCAETPWGQSRTKHSEEDSSRCGGRVGWFQEAGAWRLKEGFRVGCLFLSLVLAAWSYGRKQKVGAARTWDSTVFSKCLWLVTWKTWNFAHAKSHCVHAKACLLCWGAADSQFNLWFRLSDLSTSLPTGSGPPGFQRRILLCSSWTGWAWKLVHLKYLQGAFLLKKNKNLLSREISHQPAV